MLSDGRHLYIHEYESNASMLSRVIFYLKSVNFLFLLSIELSGAIPESADKTGFLLCAGTIPESYQFLLCAEHSKTGVYRGIHYFLIFALKHILWVFVVLMCRLGKDFYL